MMATVQSLCFLRAKYIPQQMGEEERYTRTCQTALLLDEKKAKVGHYLPFEQILSSSIFSKSLFPRHYVSILLILFLLHSSTLRTPAHLLFPSIVASMLLMLHGFHFVMAASQWTSFLFPCGTVQSVSLLFSCLIRPVKRSEAKLYTGRKC